MLGKARIRKIGLETVSVGLILCLILGMIPAQTAMAESAKTGDVQYTVYGTVYGIDGITPAANVLVVVQNQTGYGDYAYTDKNGSYTIALNWTYQLGDLINVTAFNGLKVGQGAFTVTSDSSKEVDIVLEHMPEWWPKDPMLNSNTSNLAEKNTVTAFSGQNGRSNKISAKQNYGNVIEYSEDWIVNTSQVYTNTEIRLYNCSLTVEPGVRLVLKNVMLTIWNNDTEGKYGINVKANETHRGILEILDNSIVQAPNKTSFYYHLNVEGILLLDGSTVKWISAEGINAANPDINLPSGIRLFPGSKCTIRNGSTITEGRTHNIYAEEATLTITNSNVTFAGWYGIYCSGWHPTISNNNISNNKIGIDVSFSSPTISYNKISSNDVGISVQFSAPSIFNNTIFANREQGIYTEFSSFTVRDNNISENENGIYLFQSTPNILTNTISSNYIAIYVNNSAPTVIGNTITSNYGSGIYSELSTNTKISGNEISNNRLSADTAEGYGIYARRSSLAIENNNIGGNGRCGIYCEESNAGAYHSTISGNIISNHYTFVPADRVIVKGDGATLGEGIFCLNASVTITNNIIADNVNGIASTASVISVSGNTITSNKGYSQYTKDVWVPWPPPRGSWIRVTRRETIGSGIYVDDGSVTVANNIIHENNNGIFCERYATAAIVNNNITFNEYHEYETSYQDDFGIYFDDSSSGSWKVTGDTNVKDNHIRLNGNLTVDSGGNIIMQTTESKNRCRFMLGPKFDGMYQIEILSSGIFTAKNFVLYSATDYRYLFKARTGSILTFIGTYIGHCGYNSTSPENRGVFVETNNVLIDNSEFTDNYIGLVVSGVDIKITNSTFTNIWDLNLREASIVNCLNTTFTETKVWFEDVVSILNVYWYLHIETTNETGSPVENAQVKVYDKNDNLVFVGSTSSDGTIKNIPIREYAKNLSSKIVFTPHKIKAVKTGVGSVEDYVNVTFSRTLDLQLLNTPPELSSPGVTPSSGVTGMGADVFSYTVTYTDRENDAPQYVLMYIDYIAYNMTKWHKDDIDYTDGCLYVFNTTLPKGNHTYYFEAKDWKNITTTAVFLGPEILNRVPSWIVEYPPPKTAITGLLYTYDFNAWDPDNDTLTYSLLVAPSGMSINNTTGVIFWMPTDEQIGHNNVTVLADDGYGGVISQEFVITVYVNYPPILVKNIPDISFDEDTILIYALNLNEYFIDLNPEDILTYSCYNAVNINVTINPNATVNFSAKENWFGTETITFRATDPRGGYAEDSIEVTVRSVNDPPIADAGLNQTIIANETHGTVRLTGTGFDPDGYIVLYEWDFGDGTPVQSSQFTGTTVHTYARPGNYTATFTVTDNEGATTTSNCTIYALERGWDLPVANATIWNATAGEYNLKYKVILIGAPVYVSAWYSYDKGWWDPATGSDPSGGAILGYDWNWRDMTPHSKDCNASHVYTRGQVYEIVLTVYDNQNFTDTDKCIVLVVYPPKADAGPDREVKFRTPITFYGRGYYESEPHGTIVNYTWEFGDGNVSYGATVTHAYDLPEGVNETIYTATLTVTDNYGFIGTDSCLVKVVRNYLPIAEIGPSQEKGTGGTGSVSVTLNIRGHDRDGWIKNYTLTFGDGYSEHKNTSGQPSSISGTYFHTYHVTEEEGKKVYIATLEIVDNQNSTAHASCTITVIWNFPPEVYIKQSSKLTLGRRNVTMKAVAWDRDGTISGGSWSFEDLEYIPSLDITRLVWCNPESSSSSGLGTSSASFTATKFYDKYNKLTSFNVKIIVSDNAGDTSIGVGTITVYPNQIPIIYGHENQVVYTTQESEEVVFTAIILDIDIVPGEDLNVLIEFGDGNSCLVQNIMLKNLTEEQKIALKNALAGTAAVNSTNNPLFRWLGDCMLMLELGFAAIDIDIPLHDAYYEWLEEKDEITIDDLKDMWRDIIRRVIYIVVRDTIKKFDGIINPYEAGYVELGVWSGCDISGFSEIFQGISEVIEIPGGEDVTTLIDFLLWLLDVAKALPELMTTPNINDFMSYAYYDLLYASGLSSMTVYGITMDELLENARQIVINYTYTDITAPAAYRVNVTVEDVDGGERTRSATVLFINNYPPIAASADVYGRIDNATFKCYALDFERHIIKWEWDFDGDGEFDWNVSGSWTGICDPLGFPMADKLSNDTLQNCTVEGPEVNIATVENFSYPCGGIYDATLRVTDHLNYKSYITIKAHIYPIADAGKDKTYRIYRDVPFSGMGQTLDASIEEYKWDCDGDGLFEHLQRNQRVESSTKTPGGSIYIGWFNVTHKYDQVGVYIAEYRIVDTRYKEANDTCKVTITPNHAPVANAGPDQTVKWNNMPISFDGSKSYDPDGDPLNYTWDFGDGHISYGVKPTHSYSHIGIYTVILSVTDYLGGWCKDICIITVTPDAGPDQTLWAWEACGEEYGVNFNGTGPGNITNWIWNFGDGSPNAYGQNVTHRYNSTGRFVVTLTADNLSNIASDTCVIVALPPRPNAGPDRTVWVGDTVYLNGTCYYPGGTIEEWKWILGDGSEQIGQTITHTYNVPGKYVVRLIVTDVITNDIRISAADTCTITVIDNHIPKVDAGSDRQRYWGEPLTFYGTASDEDYNYGGRIVRYRWDLGDGTNITRDVYQDQYDFAFNDTYTYSYFGKYVVNLTVWDDRGASNWDTCNVTIVNPYGDIFPPEFEIVAPPPEYCSYTEIVTIIVNLSDDCDPNPYIEAWLDDMWFTNYIVVPVQGTNNQTLTALVDMTTLALGDHILKINAIDRRGNLGECSINFTVIDDVAPESCVNTITPYWHNSSITITANASDERSDVTTVTLYYYYSTDNSSWIGPFEFAVDKSEPWEWLFDFPQGEGYYRFYSVAVDSAGSVEDAPLTYDAICGYDTTPPRSQIDIITPYWQTTATFTVTATANDTLSGISGIILYYRYSSDNISRAAWIQLGIDYETPWAWEFNTSALFGDGYYQFYSIATDRANNTEPIPAEADTSCCVDTNMPVSQVNAISPYWQTSVPFTVTANAYNGMSGIAYVGLFYRYSSDNITWSNWTIYEIDYICPYEWNFTAPNGDGYYQFYTIAADNAGNVEPVPPTPDAACGVDTITPESFVLTIAPYWQKADFIITVKASDLTSSIKEVALYYRTSPDNVSWSDWMQWDGNRTASPYEWRFTLGDGYYQFYSVAKDVAGNKEEMPVVPDAICGIDKTKPSSQTEPVLPYWRAYTTFTITAIASDYLSGIKNVTLYYRYSMDNSSWSGWIALSTKESAPWEWTFTAPYEGYYEFCTLAIDNANNVELAPLAADAVCGIDLTSPASIITAPLNGSAFNSSPINISGMCSDALSGMASVEIHIINTDTGKVVVNWTATYLYDTSWYYRFDVALYGEGNYTIRSRAIDLATNAEVPTTWITITYDITPPTIIEVVVPAEVQEAGVVVNISVKVVDNTGISEVRIELIDPNNNTIGNFPMNYNPITEEYYFAKTYTLPGRYNFTIIVKDISGNEAYAYGKFFIGDNTPPDITNVQALPETQYVYEYVNITCNVTDNVAVEQVLLSIMYQNETIINVSMLRMPNTNIYYYNTTYSAVGTYYYTILAIDTSKNENKVLGAFNITKMETTLTYIGATSGQYSDEVMFKAILVDANNKPVSNKTMFFTFANSTWTAITDEYGIAKVKVILIQIPYTYNLTVTFLEDELYFGNSTQVQFLLDKENVTLSDPSFIIVYSDCASVTVTMVDDDSSQIFDQTERPKTITLEYYAAGVWRLLASGTLLNGSVLFEIDIPQDIDEIAGSYPLRVKFDGDSWYNSNITQGALIIEMEDVILSDPSFTIVYSDNTTVIIVMTDNDNEQILHQADEPKTLILEYYTQRQLSPSERPRWIWLTIGTGTLTNGMVTFELSIPEILDDTPKNYNLRVRFHGDNRYRRGITYGTLTILKENVILSDPSTTLIYMGSTTLTICVTDDDGEELLHQEYGYTIWLYYFNGTDWILLGWQYLASGNVTFEISMPEDLYEMPGVYELMVYFYGNGTYNDAVRYGNLTIIGGYTYLAYTGPASGQYSDDVLLSAILTDYFGAGMPNRTIIFTLGNQTVNATTNETGVATAFITLMQIPGDYNLTVVFPGDEYYFASNISVPFTIEKKDTVLIAYDVVVSDPANDTLTAVLMGDSTPIAGRTIDFYINGTYVGFGVTNESGIATCFVPFLYLFGNFTWVAEFTGDEYYLPSNDSAALSSTYDARIAAIILRIDMLIEEIQNSDIHHGTKDSLISKLLEAKEELLLEDDDDDDIDFEDADGSMHAFQNELDAQRGKKIPEELYQSWYSQAEDIKYALQWMMSN